MWLFKAQPNHFPYGLCDYLYAQSRHFGHTYRVEGLRRHGEFQRVYPDGGYSRIDNDLYHSLLWEVQVHLLIKTVCRVILSPHHSNEHDGVFQHNETHYF